MHLVLYKYSGERNRVNKTSLLTQVLTTEGSFKGDVSLLSPTLLLSLPQEPQTLVDSLNNEIDEVITATAVLNFNYFYIEEFRRFYYVSSLVVSSNNLVTLTGEVDPLNSFQSEILANGAMVSRNEFTNNNLINDSERPFTSEVDVTYTLLDSGSGKNITFDTLDASSADNPLRYTLTTFLNADGRDNVLPIASGEPWDEIVYPPYDSSPWLGELPRISPHIIYPNRQVITYVLRKDLMKSLQYAISLDSAKISNIVGCVAWPFRISAGDLTDSDYYIYGGSSRLLPQDKAYAHKNGVLMPYYVLFRYSVPSPSSFIDLNQAKYDLYIPFYGWCSFPYSQCAGDDVALIYSLSAVDGSGNAFLYDVTKQKILLSYQVQVGTKIAFDTSNFRENNVARLSNGLNTILGAVSAGVSGGLQGGPFGVVAGAAGALARGIVSNMSIIDRGQISYNSPSDGMFNPLKACLRKTSPKPTFNDGTTAFSNYAHSHGVPLEEYKTLSSISGFTRVSEIHLENCTATQTEKDSIVSSLLSGVIL